MINPRELKALADKLGGMATQMGLTAGQTADLVTEIGRSPAVRKMVMDMSGQGNGSDPKYNKFLQELGARHKADPGGLLPSQKGFVRKLDADLAADPALAKKLVDGVQANPDKAALAVKNYQPGQLGAALKTMETAPAAAPPPRVQPATTTAAPATATPAATPAAAPPANKPPAAAPAPAAVPASGAAAPAATPPPAPTTTTAAPAAPAAPATAAPVDGAAAIQAARDKTIKFLSTGSDKDIAEFMQDPESVKMVMGALAEYGEKHPELRDKANGFADRATSNPNVVKSIGDNLAANPGLVRQMAKAMDEKGPSNKALDGQIKQVLGQIYEKPEDTLGSKKWIDGMQTKMAMGGAMDWVKTNLGIDLQGMLGGIGNMLQGMFAKIGDFFKQFSTGNFAQIGNMDPKAGFFTKLGRSMDQADAFRQREPQLREQSELLRKPGTQGPINDGTRGADGKVRMKETTTTGPNGETIKGQAVDYRAGDDHRVTVNAVGNNNNKVYLTDNLQPTREPNGNYRWTVAESIDPNTGKAGQLRQIVVSPEESQRLYKIMEQSAAESGKPLKISNPNVNVPTTEVANDRNVVAYDGATRTVQQVQPQLGPAANQPGTAPNNPANPADNRPKVPGMDLTAVST